MDLDVDLTCVSSFLVVVAEGSYARAAVRLHVTPSALTKRVQRLEHQVGALLLVRDPSGVTGPTAAGRRFAATAPALLAAARAARTAARGEASGPVVRIGVLGRIGELPDRAQLRALGFLLRQHHPGVRLLCRSVPFSAVHSCLLEDVVDVLWGAAAATPSAISTTPLVALERIAVVPQAHELADSPAVTTADITDVPVLYNPAVPTSWMTPFVLGDVRPLRDGRVVATDATDATSVFSAAVQEAAIIISTSWYTPLLHHGQRALRVVDLPPVAFYAARRRVDRRTPVLTVVDLLPGLATERLTASPSTSAPAAADRSKQAAPVTS